MANSYNGQKRKMKPLIKWTGGKSNEVKHLKEIIPNFDRYIEPFFGGGAVFFSLEPEKAVINDISEDLIRFYKILKDVQKRESLKVNLDLYVENWEKVNHFMEFFQENLLNLYREFKLEKIDKIQLKEELIKELNSKMDRFNGLFKDYFCIDSGKLFNEILKNIFSKLVRIRIIEIHENKDFSREEMMDHIETSFRSGFYTHFRNLLNDANVGSIQLDEGKYIATYYFIREFCYGSMFRFNEKGEFNIPYGGISYNKKNFRKKVQELFSEKAMNLLKNAEIHNLDFEELFKKINPTKKDFIFLDPPYHSEFSEYDQNSFDKDDQERLASVLLKIDAKFIMLIKKRSFIEKLYRGKPRIRISSFKKTYLYNARGRNCRNTRHLIISNF
ncbi:MAG: DNA adenine methylase [Nanoarchaeota archaeon]|nr:DNA adenine methylase [Nanoarchaeota archaeon]